VTSDARIADKARGYRQYGWTAKYNSQFPGGRNSRLDEIQAAILRVKLPHLDHWNNRRGEIAEQYHASLRDTGLELPCVDGKGEMVYHLYVIRTRERDGLMTHLKEHGVGCDIHYPIPDHLQASLRDLGYVSGDFPVTERVADEVLSIPLFPELDSTEINYVIEVIRGYFQE
jgi:dTDP-4-amino-4,6-dideoxygalactose transaminase